MVDTPPTTTTLPNPTITPTLDLDNITKGFGYLGEFATTARGIFDGLSEKIFGAGNSISNLSGKLLTAGADMSKLSVVAAVASNTILGVGTSFDGLDTKYQAIDSITNQFELLKNSTSYSREKLIELAGALGKDVKQALTETNTSLENFITNSAKSADQFLKMKSSYIDVQAASGNLGNAFTIAGDNLSGLNNMVEAHGQFLRNIAGETGNSTAQIAKNWQALSRAIPEFANAQIESSGTTASATSGLTMAMQLAAGTGRSFGDVVSNLQQVWHAYGLEGKAALEYTAQISEVTSDLGLKMETTQGFIKANVDAFQGVSDKGDNAVKVLNNMYNAFKDTGLSADQSTLLIGKMTSGLANLTLGKKAFLSAQSGGPGGLRGALQIEEQLRNGDVEGVLKKAQDSLKKQFGGKIYSQQEALQSDEGAAQFIKQREMLKSGAFGITADNDNQATRILEAFKNGTSAKKELETPEASLNKAVDFGKNLQSEGNTFISVLNNSTEALKQLNSAALFNFNQKNPLNDQAKLNNFRESSKKQSGAYLTEQQAAQQEGVGGARPVNQTNVAKGALKQAWDILPSLLSHANETDQVKFNDFKAKLGSKDVKTKQSGANELSNLLASLHSQKEAKIKAGASDEDIYALNNREQLFEGLRASISNQATGRGNKVGKAATGSAKNQSAQNQAAETNSANQRQGSNRDTTSHQVDVTVRGLCIDCGRPVQPDAHSQARTDGASGTK